MEAISIVLNNKVREFDIKEYSEAYNKSYILTFFFGFFFVKRSVQKLNLQDNVTT